MGKTCGQCKHHIIGMDKNDYCAVAKYFEEYYCIDGEDEFGRITPRHIKNCPAFAPKEEPNDH